MELKEQKLTEIRNSLDVVLSDLELKSSKGSSIADVERALFSRLLSLGLQLLNFYLFLVYDLVHRSGCPTDSLGNKMHNTGKRVRPYLSIFGMLNINRNKYYSPIDKTYYPLDAHLSLPVGRYSYVFTDWLSYGSVDLDFKQSVEQLEHILGHSLSSMQSSRQTYHLSKDVDSFYEQQDWSSIQDGTHLSVGYDGKGIPIIRSETDRKEESAVVRLSRGQKKGVKKEATISVSSSFTPQPRSKEQLLESLFLVHKKTDKSELRHQWHEHKHIRAFLSDKTKAIEYGIDNLMKRDATAKKPIIVLIDGDRALENAVKKVCKQRAIEHRVDAYILDFIHLLEYVWKVANAHLGEKNPTRQEWVYQQAERLLGSQHERVLKEWKHILEHQKLSENGQYQLERAICYLSNRPHMIDYKTYLEKGYPITTGAVESACGHFIKSRMDRNAMHWGKKGAQDMLNIRAIKKNQNWQEYLDYFIQKEQNDKYKQVA